VFLINQTDSPLQFYILVRNLKDKVLIFKLTQEDRAISRLLINFLNSDFLKGQMVMH
jgi:hypothetical protein